jgi:NADH-quinone oxidoreductase subunit J
MVEFWPFAIVGALAVAAAVLMLLSENAIHSALFLIVTMVCIAFLFLLLNAPFLAMIQITVYAGAIMVLFLFVIMLLGAEKVLPADPGEGKHRLRWFTPVAVILAVALLFVVGTPLLVGQTGDVADTTPQAQVRVVNVAADAGIVDVYAGGQLVASGLDYGDSSTFVEVLAGSQPISIVHGGAEVPADQVNATITLEPGTTQTLVAFGEGDQPSVAAVPDDVSSVPDRSGRIIVYNVDSDAPAVSLVDFGSDLVEDDTTVLAADVAAGERSEALIRPEGTADWAIADANDNANVLYELPDFEVRRNTSSLLVFANQRVFDGSLRMVTVPVVAEAVPTFGGPRAIGFELFTTYMLPFQMLAMLLLAAMVGVIVLTHREKEKRRQTAGRRRVSRPLANVIAAQVGSGSDELSGSPAQLPGAETVGK